jgi:uncharacterized RDD family membrane protein YckC
MPSELSQPEPPPPLDARLPDFQPPAPGEGFQPGAMRWRALAFLLDCALIAGACLLVLKWLVWPGFEGGMAELESFSREVVRVAVEANGSEGFFASVPQPSASLQRMLGAAQMAILLTVWSGFFLGDMVLGGRSLGKRVFRLRVVPHDRPGGLRLSEGLMRSGLKTLTILPNPLLPLLLLNYLVPVFSRERRAGHDLLCRTLVIAEPLLRRGQRQPS